jgi:hypothetical protein
MGEGMRTNYLFVLVAVMAALVAMSGVTYASNNANTVGTGNVVANVPLGYSTYFYAGAANAVAFSNSPIVSWTITSNTENTIGANILYAAVGYSTTSNSASFNGFTANVALSEFGANILYSSMQAGSPYSSNSGYPPNSNTLVFSTTDAAGSFVVVASAISNSVLSSFTTNAPGNTIVLTTNGLKEWSGIMTFNSLPVGTYNVVTTSAASAQNALIAMTAFVFPQPLGVSISSTSTPAIPATLNAGNTITFNALATGGSGTYSTYNFAIYNGGTLVANMLTPTNSFVYLIPSNQVGNTLDANVVVTDSGSNTITSALTSTFTVASAPGGAVAVNLGAAGNFALLAETAITTTGTTAIVGNIGISPNPTSSITGFGTLSSTLVDGASTGEYATSPLVTGKIYGADMVGTGAAAGVTPARLTTAIGDMYTAYTFAAGETNPTATELYAGNLGGVTLTPGLYKWSTGVTIPTSLTLNAEGNPNAVWVFQIAGALTVASGADILLTGGAQPQNIFWQVGGSPGATLGSTSGFNGIILSAYQVILNNGAGLNGRALAQTQVTLIGDAVTAPTGAPVAGTGGSFAYIIASNTPSIDVGQTENFTVSVTGSSGPYTFNIIVYNAITNLPIGENDLITSSTTASNSFVWSIPATLAGNTIYANVLVTNTLATIANSINTPAITVNSILGTPSITSVTTPIDAGQTETVAASISSVIGTGSGNIITFNLLANSGSGYASAGATCSNTISTVSCAYSPSAGTYTYEVTATDEASSPAIATSAASGSVTVAATPAITITPSSNPVIVGNPAYGGTNPTETYTLTVSSGGVGSFNIEFYNVSGSDQLGSNVVIASPGGSATISFPVYSVGSLTFNALATDQGTASPYVFNSVSSTLSINQYTTQSIGSSGAGGGVTPITSSITSTSTASSTVPATTTVLPYSVYNISSVKPTLVNVSQDATTISLLSNVPTSAELTVTNVTGSVTPPPSYKALIVLNVSTVSPANVTTTLTMAYPCSLPSDEVAPYKLTANGWSEISTFSVNAASCSITFAKPSDQVVGLFQYQQPTTTVMATTSLATTTALVNATPITQPQSKGGYILAVIIIVVIIAAILTWYLSGRKNSKR